MKRIACPTNQKHKDIDKRLSTSVVQGAQLLMIANREVKKTFLVIKNKE